MRKVILLVVGILLTFTLAACDNDIDENIIYDKPLITITVVDFGVMTFELDPNTAKNSVDNFISYVEDEKYTNNTFHRIIEDFMIQGGGMNTTSCAIEGEFTSNDFENNLQHSRGVISMARTSVNDSATSQFFIVHNDSFFLDGNYATFGWIITGFDVLDAIATVDTVYGDAPVDTVTIESITVDLRGYEPSSPKCAN